MTPQDIHGELVEFPAGKRSVLEEMERRWNAKVLLFAKRRLMLAQESGAKGPEVKRRNTEEFHDALRREFAAWKATSEHLSGRLTSTGPSALDPFRSGFDSLSLG